jgi:hypothetical protein
MSDWQIYEIPLTSGDPSFKMRTELDGDQYVLNFHWNTRDSRWYMSFYDANELPLVCGIPMLVDGDLIHRFAITGMPTGYLIFSDTSGASEECGYDDIGDRCKLYYISDV